LKTRGIMSVPVTIVDDATVITGYDPKRLIAALKLNVKVDLSAKTDWLANKYDRILGAIARATRQLPDSALAQDLPWRRQSVRSFIAHIPGDAELAWVSRTRKTASFEQMITHFKGLRHLTTVDELARYCESVRVNLIQFLQSGDTEAFNRIVTAYKGGDVTILELLNFSLRHATHHLKQLYWLMDNSLGIAPEVRATAEDMSDILTPAELFEMEN
jgi:uncharacterized damage-inducible protein DinB